MRLSRRAELLLRAASGATLAFIYFPLVVPEALMIEPTETESKETLDGFVSAMRAIAAEAAATPELLREAPHSRPVGRLDEVRAVREPVVRWQFEDETGVTAPEPV